MHHFAQEYLIVFIWPRISERKEDLRPQLIVKIVLESNWNAIFFLLDFNDGIYLSPLLRIVLLTWRFRRHHFIDRFETLSVEFALVIEILYRQSDFLIHSLASHSDSEIEPRPVLVFIGSPLAVWADP